MSTRFPLFFVVNFLDWDEFVLWVAQVAPEFIHDYVEPETIEDWRDFGWPV